MPRPPQRCPNRQPRRFGPAGANQRVRNQCRAIPLPETDPRSFACLVYFVGNPAFYQPDARTLAQSRGGRGEGNPQSGRLLTSAATGDVCFLKADGQQAWGRAQAHFSPPKRTLDPDSDTDSGVSRAPPSLWRRLAALGNCLTFPTLLLTFPTRRPRRLCRASAAADLSAAGLFFDMAKRDLIQPAHPAGRDRAPRIPALISDSEHWPQTRYVQLQTFQRHSAALFGPSMSNYVQLSPAMSR